MFYDNFVALCASVNKTPAYVGRELGIDKSTISCWKARKTKPSDVNAQKIADYFGVTVEELMGKGIKKTPSRRMGPKIAKPQNSVKFGVLRMKMSDVICSKWRVC